MNSQGIVETQVARIKQRRWKMRVPFRDAPVEVRTLVQQLARFAQTTESMWSAAKSVNPVVVGLPLAGVSVIIEVGTAVIRPRGSLCIVIGSLTSI